MDIVLRIKSPFLKEMATAEEFTFWNAKKHMKEKSMWLGTKRVGPYDEYIIDPKTNRMITKSMEYSPAALKCMWELTCNAIDASIKNKNVKNISVEYDIETGLFAVENDGGGIPTGYRADIKQYLPEAIATNPFSGTNLNKDKDRKTGGTNGLGMKLCNLHAARFVMETYDGKNGYHQVFENQMDIIGKPTITKWEDLKKKDQKMHVRIEFLPNYKELGYEEITKKQKNTFYYLCQAMAYQAAAYSDKRVSVKFNDEDVPIKSLQDYAELFCDAAEIVSFTLKGEGATKDEPWEICLGVSHTGVFQHQTLVNGIYIRGGGDHVTLLESKIVNELKDRAQKMLNAGQSKANQKRFNKNMIMNHVFLFMRGEVRDPDFDGQRKDQLRKPIKELTGYEFPAAKMTKFWGTLKEYMLETYAQKQIDNTSNTSNKKRLNLPGLRDANFAGHSNRKNITTLFVVEGDSALGMINSMITECGLGYDYNGTFNLRGVPPNTRHHIKMIKGKEGKLVPIRDNTYDSDKNKLKTLVDVLGLDYNKQYDTKEDLKLSRYDRLVIAVDQDVDGVGNIMSLVLNHIERLFPNLFKSGFVYHMRTPLIRAFPKNKKDTIKEFYSEVAYDEWKHSEFDGSEPPAAKWEIKYYKGLAGHEKPEVKQITKLMNKNLIKFDYDKNAPVLFEAYFGKDAAPRKIELATPVAPFKEYADSLELPLTVHLRRDTKTFSQAKNYRGFACFSDGLNPSRRKILMGAIDNYRQKGKAIKVFQLGGYVASNYHYHHGDMSLNGTITRMAQSFLGSNYLPLLADFGQFGTRNNGGDDAGSSRYIGTHVNLQLVECLFPSDDRYILEYNFEDGERSEPMEYPPIIPLALVEYQNTPGTGWKQVAYPRNLDQIFENVERAIMDKAIKNMTNESYLFDGTFKVVEGIEYTVGKYKIVKEKVGRKDCDIIHITELPIPTATGGSEAPQKYIEWVQTHEYLSTIIVDVVDNCSADKVNIKIVLKDDALGLIKAKYGSKDFDCIEEGFQLRKSMKPCLCFTDKQGVVHEFKSYNDIFKAWFAIRKNLYGVRFNRMIILTKLRIMYLENQIKFNEIYQTMKLTGKKIEQIQEIINENEFVKFTKSPIEDPKYVPTDKLKEIYLGADDESGKADHEYLIRMNTRDLSKESNQKRIDKVNEYKQYLAGLRDTGGMFEGAKLWISELGQLREVIKQGRATQWKYKQQEFRWE